MAIGVLNHRYPKSHFCRLADLPIELAEWPLGPPTNAATLGDLTEHDDLVMLFGTKAMSARRDALRCRLSVFQVEPPAIHRKQYKLLPILGKKYHRVLTHNSRLISRLANARFVPHGGCMLKTVPDGPCEKTGRVAMIASRKRTTQGHRMRHRIASWSRRSAPDLDLFGRGFEPLEDKRDGHAPYYFSVVIENSREPGYFTEKLIDCLLCDSLPIYWGAPDVAHFFDTRGMIVCNSEAEVRAAVAGVTEEDYRMRQPLLEENRRRAHQYAATTLNAARVLDDESRYHCWAA